MPRVRAKTLAEPPGTTPIAGARKRLRELGSEARADIFNAFNRTNLSGFFNWGASGVRPDEQGTLAFQPTQAGPARQFQFSARVKF